MTTLEAMTQPVNLRLIIGLHHYLTNVVSNVINFLWSSLPHLSSYRLRAFSLRSRRNYGKRLFREYGYRLHRRKFHSSAPKLQLEARLHARWWPAPGFQAITFASRQLLSVALIDLVCHEIRLPSNCQSRLAGLADQEYHLLKLHHPCHLHCHTILHYIRN